MAGDLLAETVSIALLDALPEEALTGLTDALASSDPHALETFFRGHIPALEETLRAKLA